MSYGAYWIWLDIELVEARQKSLNQNQEALHVVSKLALREGVGRGLLNYIHNLLYLKD